MYSTNGREHKEGNLQTLFCYLFLSLRHGPNMGGCETNFGQNPIVEVYPESTISSRHQNCPDPKWPGLRGVDIRQTRPSKRNRIAELARKEETLMPTRRRSGSSPGRGNP